MIKDYYRLLGLPRQAPFEEVKSAYRKLARQYHPDRVAGLGPELQVTAATKMLELNEAIEVLSDPARRDEYHQMLDLIPERSAEAPRLSQRREEEPPGAAAADPEGGPLPSAEPERRPAGPSPPLQSSVSKQLFVEEQERSLRSGLEGLRLKWKEKKVRGWEWVLESGDWRRTILVAHRKVESLSRMSVSGVLKPFQALLASRNLTMRATTIIAVIGYQRLADSQTVLPQLREAVAQAQGVFKTVYPMLVLHDRQAQRTMMLGKPTDYPETKRVVTALLSQRPGQSA